jgi:uncharacterized protein YydD (DUF2326 family)
MTTKKAILKVWPPMMKVTGEIIKLLLEVDDTRTVKAQLSEWGFHDRKYVSTEELINYIENIEAPEPSVTYKNKNKAGDAL